MAACAADDRLRDSLIGHWHGGLGLAGMWPASMFALVCGSSVATVAAVGAIVLPEMVRHGYPMRFGAGIITVAGSLGILMLPSIPKIIYAVSTGHRSAHCSWPVCCPVCC
jgi:TRAP-type C4-dicarboxylate transport system, large permease component